MFGRTATSLLPKKCNCCHSFLLADLSHWFKAQTVGVCVSIFHAFAKTSHCARRAFCVKFPDYQQKKTCLVFQAFFNIPQTFAIQCTASDFSKSIFSYYISKTYHIAVHGGCDQFEKPSAEFDQQDARKSAYVWSTRAFQQPS